jgi:hypothetical protein
MKWTLLFVTVFFTLAPFTSNAMQKSGHTIAIKANIIRRTLLGREKLIKSMYIQDDSVNRFVFWILSDNTFGVCDTGSTDPKLVLHELINGKYRLPVPSGTIINYKQP